MEKTKSLCPDRILSYFRAEWLPLALVTLSGLFYNIGLLASPWFEGRLAQCLADILGGSETAGTMAMLVLSYLVVTLAVQGARFVKRFYVRRFANNINRRMKGILYANLVRTSKASLEKEGAGERMTKAISDADDCVAGMDDTIRSLPEGCATVCTDGMFSQGEWQLLSIARAAAADPMVLLLDEITANLDAETEARVLKALRRASEGRTVLSISHRIYENLGGRTVEIKATDAGSKKATPETLWKKTNYSMSRLKCMD